MAEPEPLPPPTPEPLPPSGGSFLDKMGPHGTKIMIGAAILGLISVFLPAVSVSGVGGGLSVSDSVAGVRGWQGKLGLVAYVAVGVMAGLILQNPNMSSAKALSLASLITAGVSVLLAILLMSDVGGSAGAGIPGLVEVKTGIGVYLNIVASLVLVAGAVFQAKRARVF